MKYKKTITRLFLLGTIALFITGCRGGVELEDKRFAMTVGIDSVDENLKVIYEFPDLWEDTIFQTTVEEFYETEVNFNKNSDKILDYKHLKAIIIGNDMAKNQEKLTDFLQYIEKNSLFARSTLVFIGKDMAEDVFLKSKDMEGGVGEYLSKMYTTHENLVRGKMVTLGDFMNHYYNEDQVLIVPVLNSVGNGSKESVIESYQIFKKMSHIENLDTEEMDMVLLGRGIGKGKSMIIKTDQKEEIILEISRLKRKCVFKEYKGVPIAYVTISGEAKIMNKEIKDPSVLENIKEVLDHETEVMLTKTVVHKISEESLDLLNSYHLLGLRNRDLWLDYEDKQELFEENLQYVFTVDMNIV